MKAVIFLLRCILLALWLGILYNILVLIHPDRLVWFLFKAYIPVTFVVACIEVFLEKK